VVGEVGEAVVVLHRCHWLSLLREQVPEQLAEQWFVVGQRAVEVEEKRSDGHGREV
jgi:hypothetical protein